MNLAIIVAIVSGSILTYALIGMLTSAIWAARDSHQKHERGKTRGYSSSSDKTPIESIVLITIGWPLFLICVIPFLLFKRVWWLMARTLNPEVVVSDL